MGQEKLGPVSEKAATCAEHHNSPEIQTGSSAGPRRA